MRTGTKLENESSVVFYAPLPSDPDRRNCVVLPLYADHRPSPNRLLTIRRILAFSIAALLLAAAAFFLFPSDPAISLARLRLNHVRVGTLPRLSLDLSLSLVLRVRNKDFFSFGYSSLSVAVGYRGKELGFATSDGGKIGARSTSYLNATLVLDGLQVIHDVVYLLEDLARGSIPFDTDSEVKGSVGILFFQVPIKGRISCEIFVNTKNQTIMHQDCHPE